MLHRWGQLAGFCALNSNTRSHNLNTSGAAAEVIPRTCWLSEVAEGISLSLSRLRKIVLSLKEMSPLITVIFTPINPLTFTSFISLILYRYCKKKFCLGSLMGVKGLSGRGHPWLSLNGLFVLFSTCIERSLKRKYSNKTGNNLSSEI